MFGKYFSIPLVTGHSRMPSSVSFRDERSELPLAEWQGRSPHAETEHSPRSTAGHKDHVVPHPALPP